MRTGRKLLALLMALALVLSLSPAAFAVDERQEAALDRWTENGVLDGVDAEVGESISRGEAAIIIANLFGLTELGDLSGFNDISEDAAYYEAMQKCFAAGIFIGNGDGTMTPDQPLTREQFFTVFARAVGLKEATVALVEFKDQEEIADWAEGSVNALANRGYVRGVGDDMVAPKQNMTFGNMAYLLDQTIGAYANEPGAEIEGSGDGRMTIVAAPDVTVTGEAGDLIVTDGASDGEVKLQDATVDTLMVNTGADLVMDGASDVGIIEVAESAEGVNLTIAEDASVGTLTNSAAGVTISGDGAVAEVKSSEPIEVTTPNTAVTIEKTEEIEGGTKTTTESYTNDAEGKAGDVTKATVTETADEEGTVTRTTEAETTDADGNVVSKVSSTEVTETAEDGTVTKTTETETTDAEGAVTKTNPTETTATAEDGSVTKTTATETTDAEGAVTKTNSTETTATAEDGSVTKTTETEKTAPDGTVTKTTETEETAPDGSSVKTTETATTDENGVTTTTTETVTTDAEGNTETETETKKTDADGNEITDEPEPEEATAPSDGGGSSGGGSGSGGGNNGGTATVSVTGVAIDDCEIGIYDGILPGTDPMTGNGMRVLFLDSKDESALKLSATVSPANATNKGVTWSALNMDGNADESVLAVDADGGLTIKGQGFAYITVTTRDGGFTEKLVALVFDYYKLTFVNSANEGEVYEDYAASETRGWGFDDLNDPDVVEWFEFTVPEGKVFKGWQDQKSGRIYTPDSAILYPTEEMTFVAIWEDPPVVTYAPGAIAINGKNCDCNLYTADGEYYITLRDLAALLSGTEHAFDVGYDAEKAVATLTTGVNADYSPAKPSGDKSDTAVSGTADFLLNGKGYRNTPIYNIDGTNYFLVNALSGLLGFEVDAEPKTLTFDANGGYFLDDANRQILSFSNKIKPCAVLTNPLYELENYGEPIREGYQYMGMYYGDENIKPDSELLMDKDITLTAKWVKLYTVTFADGDTVYATQKIAEGAYATPPEVPAREGMEFEAWEYDTGSETVEIDFSKTPITADLTVFPVWNVNYYEVSYVYDGTVPAGAPALPETRTYAYSVETVTVEAAPSLDGYTFTGWTTSDVTVSGGQFVMPAKNVELKGSWTAVPSYTVKFDSDGGTTYDDVPVQSGSTVTRPGDPEKTGYKFEYWYAEDAVSAFDFSTPITADLTLTAKWSAQAYNVTLNAGDNATINGTVPETYTYGVGMTLPTDVTMDGWSFEGWKDSNNNIVTEIGKTETGDKAFTAIWLQIFTVEFNAGDGGSGTMQPQTGKDGDTLTLTENAFTRAGHTFAGWKDNDSTATYEDGGTITLAKNVTLVAQWTPIAVTGVSLDKTSATLAIGATETLTATVNPSNAANTAVEWSSSDETVATVADGVVTAVAPGTATITAASAADGTKTDTCTVTVGKAVISAATFTIGQSTALELKDTNNCTIPSSSYTAGISGVVDNGTKYWLTDVNSDSTVWSFANDVKVTLVVAENGSLDLTGVAGLAFAINGTPVDPQPSAPGYEIQIASGATLLTLPNGITITDRVSVVGETPVSFAPNADGGFDYSTGAVQVKSGATLVVGWRDDVSALTITGTDASSKVAFLGSMDVAGTVSHENPVCGLYVWDTNQFTRSDLSMTLQAGTITLADYIYAVGEGAYLVAWKGDSNENIQIGTSAGDITTLQPKLIYDDAQKLTYSSNEVSLENVYGDGETLYVIVVNANGIILQSASRTLS